VDIDLKAPGLRDFADALPVMIMISDARGVVTYFNRRWHEFTGQPPFHRDVAEYWRSRIHPDDVAFVAEQWGRAVERGDSPELTYRLRNARTGRFHRVFARAVATRDSTGNIVQWIGTATDLEDFEEPVPTAGANGDARAADAQPERLTRVTVTLRESLAERLTAFRDAFNLSVSSIVEHAVEAYLERGQTDEVAEDLRARGATRRRRSS